ncbi:carbonic anhydrase [Athelia psychrophila]|uniref:Carbonic anhydrase n=1 Tax=Athelia psychrophila TaxID=1759441 RepID=A0A166SLS4_9AGAM|nr:carbonic anhydrase [Fibularhizoctonia sp. CBS 109695]
MAHTHPVLSQLLQSNSQWAEAAVWADPDYFKQGVKGQSPKVLWIGCADSRVPESLVTACKPGDIFVHRNIANQFHLDDDSAQSVLSYAITALGVQHVLVVGHTHCGGAAACMSAARTPSTAPAADTPLGRWLAPLTSIASSIIEKAPNAPLDVLVEENVRAQVANLSKAPAVQAAWEGGKTMLWIHGLVYKIEDGTLADLAVSMGPDVDPEAEKEEAEKEKN